jgi:hypothetical protein
MFYTKLIKAVEDFAKHLLRYRYRALAEAESAQIGSEAGCDVVCNALAESIELRTTEIRSILKYGTP